MRKLLLTLTLALAGLLPSAYAQQQVPIVAGVVTVNTSQANYFKVYVTSAITSVVLTPSPNLPRQITVLFSQDATGHPVTFTQCSVSASANVVTACPLLYDATVNTWVAATPQTTSAAPTGAAGGALGCTYPNPCIATPSFNVTGNYLNTQYNAYLESILGGCSEASVLAHWSTVQSTTYSNTDAMDGCLETPSGTGLATNGNNNGISGYAINNNSLKQGAWGDGTLIASGIHGYCWSIASNSQCEGGVSEVSSSSSLSGVVLVGHEVGLLPQNTTDKTYGFLESMFGNVQPTFAPAFDVNVSGGTARVTSGYKCETNSLFLTSTYFTACLDIEPLNTSASAISQGIEFTSLSSTSTRVTTMIQQSTDSANKAQLRYDQLSNLTDATFAFLPDTGGSNGLSPNGNISFGSISLSSATSGSHTFANAYLSAPFCTITEVGTTPSSLTNAEVTSSTTTVTVTAASSITATFNFVCGPAAN